MTWSRQLESASFRGVTFDCQSVEDTFQHRLCEYAFPWKDGAELDDFGRHARRTQITAIFFGEAYETQLGQFLKVVDEGKPGTFVHPILGSWQARLQINRVMHSADQGQDIAVVEVEVIEEGTSTRLPELASIPALQEEVRLEAEELAQENNENTPEVTSAVQSAKAFASQAEALEREAASRINHVRSRLEAAVEKVRRLGDLQSYRLVRACHRLKYACEKLFNRMERKRPKLVEVTVEVPMPLVLLAHRLYGDASRADEIRQLNRMKNPFWIPAGTKVNVYAR